MQRKETDLEEREQRLALVEKQLMRMEEDLERRTEQGQRVQELLIARHKEMQEQDDRTKADLKKLKQRERRLAAKKKEFDELIMSKGLELMRREDADLRKREARLEERAARFVRMQVREQEGAGAGPPQPSLDAKTPKTKCSLTIAHV